MYPDGELTRLAAHKAALRQRITARRREIATGCTPVVRAAAWLDRAHALWRRLVPLIRATAVPLALLLARSTLARPHRLKTLLSGGVLLVNLWRHLARPRPRPD